MFAPRCRNAAPWLLWLAGVAAAAQHTVHDDTFAAGGSSWTPYHADEPRAAIARIEGQGRDGSAVLRVTCPGERPLEGVSFAIKGGPEPAPAVTPWTLYSIRAEVRGRGDVWLCAHSANGWIYAPRTLALTGSWQPVTLSKLTGGGDAALSVSLLAKSAHPMVLEIDRVTVTAEIAPPAQDAPVPPMVLEAEDLPTVAGSTSPEPDASGGRAVDLQIYGRIDGIPFPLTTRPTTLFARVLPGTADDVFHLVARLDGLSHRLASAPVDGDAGWQWLSLSVPEPSAARGTVALSLGQPKRRLPKARVDRLVVSTDASLDPEALADQPPLHARRPLLRIGRASDAPAVDGRPDDACWRDTTTVHEFSLNAGGLPPTQSTSVRLCYDARAIYLWFRCREHVLQPEANQRHAFRQALETPDSTIWKDDSVVVLVAPAGEADVYDVFCNVKGVVADARCRTPDLWGSRDSSWNGGIRAAGRIGEGFWDLELAIPFAGMGLPGPASGDTWRIGMGRLAQEARENSSWHPVTRGFHEAEALGWLVFGDTTPGFEFGIPAALSGGPAAVTCLVAPGSTLLADVRIGQPGRPDQWSRRAVTGESPVDLTFSVAGEGSLTLAAGALNAADLTPRYMTPPMKRPVKALDCRVQVASDGPFTLYLNGRRVATGRPEGGVADVTVPLESGVNAFAIDAATGRAAAVLGLPDAAVVTDTSWRVASGRPEGFAEATHDDSGWARARLLGEAPGPLAELGASTVGGEGPGVLRRLVLFEHTAVWPTPEPALHVPRNAPQHITFSTTGIPGRRLADFALHLCVPPDFEVIGATGYYGRTREEKAQFRLDDAGSLKVGDTVFRHTAIRATAPLPYRPKVRILELVNVFVAYAGAEPHDTPTRFLYWTDAEGGCVTECRQSFAVRVSPPLDGRQPKRLLWQLWGSFFGSMDDPAMKAAALRTARLAGFNNIVSGTAEDTQIGESMGFANTMGINFEPWSLDRRDYLGSHPDAALVDREGKPSTKYVCASALLEEGWPDVETQLARKIGAQRPHVVDWDYESNPFSSYLSCYCARCVSVFRTHAGLPADASLSPDAIEAAHAAAWIDFMTTRNARLAALFRRAANANGASFSMYSGYQSEETQRIYGVDWAKIGSLEAADHVGCGYGRSPELVQATRDALNGIPLVTGVLMQPYDRSLNQPVLPLTKARILRRQADSTGGILVYDRLPLAGRSWTALAEISRLVATHEDFFPGEVVGPTPFAVSPDDEPDLALRRAGSKLMLLLMNHGRGERTYTLTPAAGCPGRAEAFFSGATLDLTGPVRIDVPAGDAEAVLMELPP